MNFGQKLARELKRHFYTQTDLAKKSGISAMAINHFIHNRRQPSLANLSRLLRALPDTDVRWLLVRSKGEGHSVSRRGGSNARRVSR